MLPDVVVGEGLLVRVVVPLEAWVREVLLVLCPGDLLGVQQVDDGGDVGWNAVVVVVVHAERVTACGGAVVGLRGVGDGEEVCERDPLRGEPFLVAVRGGVVVVLLGY